ncbi:MAG: spermidine/putrescine ABC transporter permease PotC, partial [Mesorhizobium sp.]
MAEPRVMDIKDQPGFRSIAIICLLVLYVPVLILMI